jgi:hypothetical protein
MPTTCDIGGHVRLTGVFTAPVGVDPGTVSVIVFGPNGGRVTYVHGTDAALVKDSTGNYHLDYAPTMAGTHWYRWVSTGSGHWLPRECTGGTREWRND